MKLSENDNLMRQSFSPSFMRIEQKMWIFTNGQYLNVSHFFFIQNLERFVLETLEKKHLVLFMTSFGSNGMVMLLFLFWSRAKNHEVWCAFVGFFVIFKRYCGDETTSLCLHLVLRVMKARQAKGPELATLKKLWLFSKTLH